MQSPVRSVISHALVAKSVVILAEHSSTSADYSSATAPVLEHLASHAPDERERMIVHGRHRMYVLPRQGLVFIAIADASLSVIIGHGMIADMANRFIATYGKGYEMPTIALPYAMNEFAKTITLLMVPRHPAAMLACQTASCTFSNRD